MDKKPELIKDKVDGAYSFGDHPANKRYTAYVKYTYGDEMGDYAIEEIDVNAVHRTEATAIAEAALAAEYEEGGEIVEVREQIGMYF